MLLFPKSSIVLKYALLLIPYFISVTSVSHFSPKFSVLNSLFNIVAWILYSFSSFSGIQISIPKSVSANKCAFHLHENHFPYSTLLSFDDSLRFRSFIAYFYSLYVLTTYNTMNVEYPRKRIIQKWDILFHQVFLVLPDRPFHSIPDLKPLPFYILRIFR